MIASVLTLVASLLFEWPGGRDAWWALYPRFAELPTATLTVAAALSGALVGWAGWKAGSRPAAIKGTAVA